MLDPQVHIDRVASVTGFDNRTLLPSDSVVVTYRVGDHGPFTLTTPAKEFSETYVEAETTKRANQLRALGVVPA